MIILLHLSIPYNSIPKMGTSCSHKIIRTSLTNVYL